MNGTTKKKTTRAAPAVRLVAGPGGRIEVRPAEKLAPQQVGKKPGLVYEHGRWLVTLGGPVKDNVWERFRTWFKGQENSEQRVLYNILTAWRSDDSAAGAKDGTTAVFRAMMGGPLRQELTNPDAVLLSDEASSKLSGHAKEHLRLALAAASELGYIRYEPFLDPSRAGYVKN